MLPGIAHIVPGDGGANGGIPSGEGLENFSLDGHREEGPNDNPVAIKGFSTPLGTDANRCSQIVYVRR